MAPKTPVLVLPGWQDPGPARWPASLPLLRALEPA
jgi:hypothetical protein